VRCICSKLTAFNVFLCLQDAASLDGVVLVDAKGEGGPVLDQERFPGMSFSIRDASMHSKITVAIFETGNGVGTGIKQPQQMNTLRAWLNTHMHKYRLGAEYRQQNPSQVRTRKRKLACVVSE
jgi:TATA-box binding protein (TBP) (component of TFIID and TFIIIB)